MITAVDSSVILDVVTDDPAFAEASERALRKAAIEGQLVACECVHAEIYPAFDGRSSFGEFLVECSGGSIRLALDGQMTVQPLGEAERPHAYAHERRGFGGDCCHATLCHFIECLSSGRPFETEGEEYLRTLAVQEAFYESARTRSPVDVRIPST